MRNSWDIALDIVASILPPLEKLKKSSTRMLHDRTPYIKEMKEVISQLNELTKIKEDLEIYQKKQDTPFPVVP